MTGSKTLGVVIGERRLTMRGARAKRVTVKLGTPRLPKGEQDWECPFQITGGGIRIFQFGYGCDAIQAIQTALGGIRYYLDKSGKSFEWFGLGIEVGFPRVIPSYGDTRLTKRLESWLTLNSSETSRACAAVTCSTGEEKSVAEAR